MSTEVIKPESGVPAEWAKDYNSAERNSEVEALRALIGDAWDNQVAYGLDGGTRLGGTRDRYYGCTRYVLDTHNWYGGKYDALPTISMAVFRGGGYSWTGSSITPVPDDGPGYTEWHVGIGDNEVVRLPFDGSNPYCRGPQHLGGASRADIARATRIASGLIDRAKLAKREHDQTLAEWRANKENALSGKTGVRRLLARAAFAFTNPKPPKR